MKKNSSTVFLIRYLNIAILYFKFHANRRWGKIDSLDCAYDTEKLLESEEIYKATFIQIALEIMI